MYGTKEIAVEQAIQRKVTDYRTCLEQKLIPKPQNCQLCKHAGSMRWHGYYTRSLMTMTQTYTLPIRRIFCAFCCHTFSCIPKFVMKFRRYAKDIILLAVSLLRSHSYESVADKFAIQGKRCLAILTLYFWRYQLTP